MTKYPLAWPIGWKRTKEGARFRARFNKKVRKYQDDPDPAKRQSYLVHGDVTIAEGTSRVLKSLALLGATGEAIISSNLTLRLDGLPRGGQGEPHDPGVAVYWSVRRQTGHKVMAIDQYDRVADNLAAIAATLEAMRAIERHGGATILERTFTGFTALPEPNNWRHVLGFTDGMLDWSQVQDRYRDLAKTRHPDRGGTEAAMMELNRAYADARRELA